jgi:para-nitrobenzyl esterase
MTAGAVSSTQEGTSMLKYWCTVALFFVAFSGIPARAETVLVLSTGSTQLDSKIQSVLESHGHVVTIGSNFTEFSGAELARQGVVLLLPTLDDGNGNMPIDGQNALVNFVSQGGGLVTSEWTIWMSAFRPFQVLKPILPVVTTDRYSEKRDPITYTVMTADPVLNQELPPSLTFNSDFFYGTETFFAPRSGATVFYNSSGAAGGAGLVGWQYHGGRVIQFSTLFGPNQLGSSQAGLLLANAVSWAGDPIPLISEIGFSPNTVRLGSSFTAKVAGTSLDENTYVDLRFRVPGSTTDEFVMNWQQGPAGSHPVARNISLGMWTVTGVRAHRERDDHSGSFDPVAANFTVVNAPLVSSVSFDPPSVVVGSNSTGRLLGTDLTNSTYVDVRFRKPGSVVDEIVLNWQQGLSGSHNIPANTPPGNWAVTGARAHENKDDHAGDFDHVLGNLAVVPTSCVVSTTAGVIYGRDLGGSCAFLGIPYAAPPLGNLRWKPPQPAAPWDPRILDATTAPTTCSASEDCLKLNIWMPKTIGTAAPVFVWLHTGAFVAASANFAGHDGRKLAEQTGVIVVAPNYRLGPFGFLAHTALTNETPGYPSSGNYGFLDQRAAMTWVKNNIAAFGGDVSRVTIGGQSAGAHSVSLHVVSPGSAGLFHGAVMESGFASMRWRTREEAELQGNEFAALLGCADARQVLSCLRSKSIDQVLRALPASREEFIEAGPARWSPVVDGLEIPDQPRILYERGAFNQVPMIIGVTRDEGWTFVDRSFPAGLTSAQFEAAIEKEFGTYAPAFLARYRVSDFPSPKDALVQVTGDVEFICEAVRIARLVERTRTPVYLYSFQRVLDGVASNRVIHGLGTNFVFGNDFVAPNPANYVLNPTDLQLSASMGAYWTRFVALGDPGSDKIRWPAFDRRIFLGLETDKFLVLDSVIREDKGLRQDRCDFLEPFYFRSVVGGSPASTP